jgi:AraC family transcriptional regulator, transcriptional activator FtrA
MPKLHLVAALAYDGLCTFEFGCAVEVFGLDRTELGVDWYRFEVCSIERTPIRALGGIRVVTRHGINLLDRADTIVIPGWRDIDDPPPTALLRKLQRAHTRGARLCTICSGVFVLAAAGLLTGMSVTTHWRYADALARRYPELTIAPNALYVDNGQIITSAGSAAGLDMMLHLVKRDYGARIANRVAQRLVIPPHRDGGQAQFLPRPVPSDDGTRIAHVLEWARANIQRPLTLRSMAQHAGVSTRTLQRQFVESTGMAPGEWLIKERVAVAKELLELGRDRVSDIATHAGFGSEESLRRHFKLIVGVAPNTYRSQFYTGDEHANARQDSVKQAAVAARS